MGARAGGLWGMGGTLGHRERERWGPGPDTESGVREKESCRAPAQTVLGPDTESAGPDTDSDSARARHKRAGLCRAGPAAWRLCVAAPASLCQGPALSVSGPGALCVGARRSLYREPGRSLCRGPALSVLGRAGRRRRAVATGGLRRACRGVGKDEALFSDFFATLVTSHTFR